MCDFLLKSYKPATISWIIGIYAAVSIFVCFFSNYLVEPSSRIYYDRETSDVFVSMHSREHICALYFFLGASLTIVWDIVLDIAAQKILDCWKLGQGLTDRLILISIICLPNMFLLYYVIPSDQAIYIPIINSARIIAFSAIFGIYVNTIPFLGWIIIGITSNIIKSFGAFSSASLFAYIAPALLVCILVLMLYNCSIWTRYLLRKGFSQITVVEYSCSLYILTVSIGSLVIGVIRSITFNGFIDKDSSSSTLVVFLTIPCLIVLCLTSINGRAMRMEMINNMVSKCTG